MKVLKVAEGNNSVRQAVLEGVTALISVDDVANSWESAAVDINIDKLRPAQSGALYAIKAHWTVSSEPATIVMPTGTGKTEAMIATVISERVRRTLVVVPSDMLRKQTVDKFMTFGALQDIGVISSTAIKPSVTLLKSTPRNLDELLNILEKSNVIVTTMSILKRFTNDFFDAVNNKFDALIVDEAHHVPAKTWAIAKHKLKSLKCLQFTATPFRNDGKKIDGRIIYNFPLRLSQEHGYFQEIDFIALEEFDDEKGDYAIAEAAVNRLESDVKKGYDHIVLVRANSKNYANYLYNSIYAQLYSKYNPVLIHSDAPKTQRTADIERLKSGNSRIVVCVDMFGEGIDIPNLKIAAIHEKHKSLPITLQFIGRFARSKEGLGTATIVTNIANDELNECLSELYAQDSDWNVLLNKLSYNAIQREIRQQDFSDDFDLSMFEGMKIEQLRPKVSMVAYKAKQDKWLVNNMFDKFDPDTSRCAVSEERGIAVIIQKVDSGVDWTSFKGINDVSWNLHVIYWNKKTGMFFINSTDKSIADRLADALFESHEKISGENVFRCLFGIKRLMLGTVGLKSGIDGPVRYRMFAGVDIKNGISESQIENSYKSNLFGTGYEGNGKTSIGCSHKGKIWSRWVESIDYWTEWCDKIAVRLRDNSIDTSKIFEGALVPEVIKSLPSSIPYSIEWPIDLELRNDLSATISRASDIFSIYEMDMRLSETQIDGSIRFTVGNPTIFEEFELKISDDGFNFSTIKPIGLEIKLGKQRKKLREFFNEYPPRVKFIDQSTLEGNLLVRLTSTPPPFKQDCLLPQKWTNVDIRKESQGVERKSDTIQYHVIQNLIASGNYCLIFDDDGAGEIADIIAIIDSDQKLIFQFYHCKYAHGDKPGARVSDLYEVCGQAEKSVKWCQDKREIITRLRKRESFRSSNGGTRFEVGNLRKLKEINNKMRVRPVEVEIFIVQPGLSASAVTDDMKRLLSGTSSYLMDTFSIELKVICSE